MSGRSHTAVLVSLALLTAGTSCLRREPAAERPPRLALERAGPGRGLLLDIPVRVAHCGRDSVLAVVGTGGKWSAALALRTGWPLRPDSFTVDTVLGALGSATAAVRPVGDSVGAARIATAGSVVLTGSPPVEARVTLTVGGDSLAERLTGRILGLRADTSGCPTP